MVALAESTAQILAMTVAQRTPSKERPSKIFILALKFINYFNFEKQWNYLMKRKFDFSEFLFLPDWWRNDTNGGIMPKIWKMSRTGMFHEFQKAYCANMWLWIELIKLVHLKYQMWLRKIPWH